MRRLEPKLVKRGKDIVHKLVFQAEKTLATRGLVQGAMGNQNVIQLKIKLRTPREDKVTGMLIDELEIELSMEEANELCGDLSNAVDSIMPRRRRGMSRIPWD